MDMIATRLHSGQDLKLSIAGFATEKKVSAGAIVCAAGSLSKLKLRMAGAAPDVQVIKTYEGHFEIVSLIGSIAKDGNMHLHGSFSDGEGRVIGGHVKDGCIVHTTVELIIANDNTAVFTRERDEQTGFDELVVKEAA